MSEVGNSYQILELPCNRESSPLFRSLQTRRLQKIRRTGRKQGKRGERKMNGEKRRRTRRKYGEREENKENGKKISRTRRKSGEHGENTENAKEIRRTGRK